MGQAEIIYNELIISSHIITYGNAADAIITERIRHEIETMWNEPQAELNIKGSVLKIKFRITADFQPGISFSGWTTFISMKA